MITIAHAVCDERGRTSGGAAGNQTANLYHTTGELRFSEWYNPNGGGWDYLIRPKKRAKAIAIASAAMSAVRNSKIGYDQSDCDSLYDQIQYAGFDPAKAGKPCNCDCCRLVTVCCNYAGIPILRGTYTGNFKERCEAVGFFKIYKGAKYTKCSNYLKDGDILLRVGHHAAIVVNTMYHMTRYLKIGSTGTDVLYLQQALNEYLNKGLKRYAAIKEDGEFGIKTQYLLIEYQRIFKLETDGIMGPLTAAHMGFKMMEKLLKEISEFLQKSVDDNAETHTYRSYDYTVTVSDNPKKIIISDNFTGEKKKIRDCNSLEITLLALVNSLCKEVAHEYKES